MKLEDIRRRAVALRLKDYRDRLSQDLMPALVCSLLTIGLFLGTLMSPDEWANGNWFKPGGWLHERFGMEGAVLAVRATMGLVALLVAGYFVWTVYRLTGGLKARRAQIAETYDVFDPPDQPRQR